LCRVNGKGEQECEKSHGEYKASGEGREAKGQAKGQT
jgi:hypothetical protein